MPLGSVVKTHKSEVFEWKISNVSSLTVNSIDSPCFIFANASWRLQLYPTGNRGVVHYPSVFLIKRDNRPPFTVTFTFGVKKSDGDIEQTPPRTFTFGRRADYSNRQRNCSQCDISEFQLLHHEFVPLPGDTLTILFTMWHTDNSAEAGYVNLVGKL